MDHLEIRNFAHISNASINFNDLTVLVGAQGTGKSLVLQWFKAVRDGKQVVEALKQAGQDVGPDALIDQIFGVGMGSAWTSETSIKINNKPVSPNTLSRRGSSDETVFFIPAHRSMLISDGWAMPFQKMTSETPVVARLFSQNLFNRFSSRGGDQLFPLTKVLKSEYRKLINDAVFHGGAVGLEKDVQHSKRLKLSHGDTKLPFMTWTAGQREFTPLLLGLYHLLPSTKIRKRKEVDYVVIEEPEMGLHPQAITVFMVLVLDLLWRGYKVVLSTHSPTLLTALWMLKRLHETNAPWKLVCEAFNINTSAAMQEVATTALKTKISIHLMKFNENNRIESKDISSLDPGDEDDDISGWGGLTGFSSNFGAIVRKSANLENK